MYEDDVLRELWGVKDAMAAKYNYDVHALAKALREKQGKDGRKIVTLSPKRPTTVSRTS